MRWFERKKKRRKNDDIHSKIMKITASICIEQIMSATTDCFYHNIFTYAEAEKVHELNVVKMVQFHCLVRIPSIDIQNQFDEGIRESYKQC